MDGAVAVPLERHNFRIRSRRAETWTGRFTIWVKSG
jgi:hypothetical protein